MAELRRLNLVMLLLFTLQARMDQTEAVNTCGVRSAYFLGLCLIDHHCEMVCKIEGFPAGQCLGLIPHCICLGTCQQQSPPSPPPVIPPESPPPVPPPKPVYSLPPPLPVYSLPPPLPVYSLPPPQPVYSLPPPPPEYSPTSAADLL